MEPAQVERGVVEDALGLAVGLEQDLEAAVQAKAVELVRAHPAAHAVGGLEHHRGDAAGAQLARRAEAGEARADDDDRGGGRGAQTSSGRVSLAASGLAGERVDVATSAASTLRG